MTRTPKALLLLLLALSLLAALAGCNGSDSTGKDAESAPVQDEDSGEGEEANERDEDAMLFEITSTAYEDGGEIAVRYARGGVVGGENVSPPYSWSDVPEGAKSFALVMVDRHPAANEWIHWMVVDIPATATGLPEGASGSAMPSGPRELDTTWGGPGYGGPQPPLGSGDHDYEITIYALKTVSLDLPQDADFAQFLTAIRGEMLGAATIVGHFGR